jgi:hypothetical protein
VNFADNYRLYMWVARYISTVVWHSLRMRHEIRLELVGGLLAAGSLFGIGVAPVLAAATSVTPCVLPADVSYGIDQLELVRGRHPPVQEQQINAKSRSGLAERPVVRNCRA